MGFAATTPRIFGQMGTSVRSLAGRQAAHHYQPYTLHAMQLSATYRLGITGGIGAGKSVVAQFFGLLGIPCYNADARAKALMALGGPLAAELIALFGPLTYVDGVLNKAHLAATAFADPACLKMILDWRNCK